MVTSRVSKSETLYLVDGSGYIFRAFYAIRPLSTSKGLPTNAIYGFTNMLLKLLREKKPDHIAVIFDAGRKTFRNDEYPDYKANRLEPPEELVPQFPYFRKVVQALNIPCLEAKNYEADDIIGTLAEAFDKEDVETVIVTGDKDLMQLVSDRVTLLDTMKEREVGIKEVEERFGVLPERVPDVLGLAGDSSDNIPGVPGVGEKTAMKLLKEYGSLEGILAHADEIKGKLGEKIRAHTEEARLFQRLATVKRDVPLEYHWDDFRLTEPDREALQKLFKELEFHTLLGELAPQKTLSSKNYHLVTSDKALQDMIANLEACGAYALDTETSSLDAMRAELVGLSFSGREGEAYYVPVGHVGDVEQLDRDQVIESLRPLLEGERIPQYGQNIKYDMTVLARHGLSLNAVTFDTMIAAYLVNPTGSRSLDALSLEHLGHKTITFKELVGTGKKQKLFSEVPLDQATNYAAEDADVTYRLVVPLKQKLQENNQENLFASIEMPLVGVLTRMELHGVKIDEDCLNKISKEYDAKLKSLSKRIYGEAKEEFNIKSTKQLSKVLFESMGLPIIRRTKTGYSTDTDVLQTLAHQHPIAELLLEYRALSKLKSTYVDALPKLVHPETGRIHTSFNQTIAATGRLSSSDPNLQNIPIRSEEGRRIRDAFVADEGRVLIDADYSQIELRILAHCSQDARLLSAFHQDQDVHAATASGLFDVPEGEVTSEQRAIAKTVNFGVLYGQSAFGLSNQLGIEMSEAQQYIDNFYTTYEGVAAYKEKVLSEAAKAGYVETLFGRRRYFPELSNASPGARANIERMAFNSVFQGTAADIIKKAMIDLDRMLLTEKFSSRLILQVHDELVLEVSQSELADVQQHLVSLMEGAADLSVPLKVDVGSGASWMLAKP